MRFGQAAGRLGARCAVAGSCPLSNVVLLLSDFSAWSRNGGHFGSVRCLSCADPRPGSAVGGLKRRSLGVQMDSADPSVVLGWTFGILLTAVAACHIFSGAAKLARCPSLL